MVVIIIGYRIGCLRVRRIAKSINEETYQIFWVSQFLQKKGTLHLVGVGSIDNQKTGIRIAAKIKVIAKPILRIILT